MEFSTNDELTDFIYNKFKNDYILLIGNYEAITAIENNLYPPNTELNKDFEIICSGATVTGLCKRNKKFSDTFDDDPEHKIIILHLTSPITYRKVLLNTEEIDLTYKICALEMSKLLIK